METRVRVRRPRAMRRDAAWSCAVLSLLLVSAIGSSHAESALEAESDTLAVNVNVTLTVSALALGAAPGWAAACHVVAGALRATGAHVAVWEGAVGDCHSAPYSAACRRAVLDALYWRGGGGGGAVELALPTTARQGGALALRLRDVGLRDLGDAAPAAHAACAALRAAPPAWPALAHRDVADGFTLPADQLKALLAEAVTLNLCPPEECPDGSWAPAWCTGSDCATVLLGGVGELRALRPLVQGGGLRARLVPLGPALSGAVAAAAPHPLLVCATELPDGAGRLSVPPCPDSDDDDDCPFETRRLVKLGDALSLARSARVARLLARFSLTEEELRELAELATNSNATWAAREWGSRPAGRAAVARWAGGGGREVRVAVLLPVSGRREAYDGAGLAAAAELAGEELAPLKVQRLDAGCSRTLAFKRQTDALGSGEYEGLAALVGPACGAARGPAAALAAVFRLPLLAYTATGAAGGAAARWQLLGGGAAGARAAAAAALLQALGWRRAALLAEGVPPDLQPALARVDLVAHTALPDNDDERVDYDLIDQWVENVKRVDARILLLAVEDARVARAAVCAAGRAGLSARAGGVIVLLAELPDGWLDGGAGDGRCTPQQLAQYAEGHLVVGPAWADEWRRDPAAGGAAWRARWRAACEAVRREARGAGALRAAASHCVAPDAHAALLYDVLQLWARALRRQLAARPASLDELHHPAVAMSILNYTVSINYTGVTGPFEWEVVNGAHVRAGAQAVSQWLAGELRPVARWRGGILRGPVAARWLTPDGAVPRDGPDCAAPLRPLAAVLGGCGAAAGALVAAALGTLLAALAGGALLGRRRLRRRYRARLAALALQPLPAAPPPASSWELPRSCVVINRKLGMGAFGAVYGGHALLREGGPWSAVAVKTLRPGATTEEKLDFLSEAETMKRFEHKNVVRLLGVVTQTEPVCTVMEFMLYGDLKGYLLARRHLPPDSDEVSPERLTGMARDAARALSYLAELRYVHRDVAARNCLVSARRQLKLADFGMTRPVFESDYYRIGRNGMLPVRWMAPESLALGVFSPASDVWAFGVLLYEMVTFGALPHQGLTNREVLAHVKAGGTPRLPDGLKPQLSGLMKSCWARERSGRPAAREVAALLADSPRLLHASRAAPLDALPLAAAPWRLPDHAELRWGMWGTEAGTDITYVSDPPEFTEPPESTVLTGLTEPPESTDLTEPPDSAEPTEAANLLA